MDHRIRKTHHLRCKWVPHSSPIVYLPHNLSWDLFSKYVSSVQCYQPMSQSPPSPDAGGCKETQRGFGTTSGFAFSSNGPNELIWAHYLSSNLLKNLFLLCTTAVLDDRSCALSVTRVPPSSRATFLWTRNRLQQNREQRTSGTIAEYFRRRDGYWVRLNGRSSAHAHVHQGS